ncbi:MAG: Flp family type IVb pilin [Tepidisphaeraceae bacterium]|jgi:Flp pilus assembly pilin Flp
MNRLWNVVGKLVSDDRGGELFEYLLIAGLVALAAIAIITTVGTQVIAKWTSLSDSL